MTTAAQPEVTIRLPRCGEGARRVLTEDMPARAMESGEEFVVPAGTEIRSEIQFTRLAKWVPDLGWIFEVQTVLGNTLWVTPSSPLDEPIVSWEAVPDVEAPVGPAK